MPERLPKINQLLKQELSRLILKELGSNRDVLVTLTDVSTAKDLSACSVFVSVFPKEKEEKAVDWLNRKSYHLHQFLNKRLSLRKVPKLNFRLDKEKEQFERLDQILRKLKDKYNLSQEELEK